MENVIYKSVSSDLKFINEDLQNKLINFEKSLLNQKKSYLKFIVSLAEFRKAFLAGGSEWRVQKTTDGQGHFFFMFLENKFGFSEKTVRRHLRVLDRFTNYKECLDDSFQFVNFAPIVDGYSPAKLFELLSLTDTEIKNATKKGLLKAEMSVRQIRDYVKSLKGTEKKENQQVEDASSDNEVEEAKKHNANVDNVIDDVKTVIKRKLKNYKDDLVEDLIYYVCLEIYKLKK